MVLLPQEGDGFAPARPAFFLAAGAAEAVGDRHQDLVTRLIAETTPPPGAGPPPRIPHGRHVKGRTRARGSFPRCWGGAAGPEIGRAHV